MTVGAQDKLQSDVGKTWKNLSVPLDLFASAAATSPYSGKCEAYREYVILAESNGRAQIQHANFDAPDNKIWVNKNEGKVI